MAQTATAAVYAYSSAAVVPVVGYIINPIARPLIEALDYAQRTNTIGSLKSAAVCINWAAARHSASELASALALHQFSRSITAPMALTQSQPQVIII